MTASIPHQALYRRWRAQTFSEIVGQEAVDLQVEQRGHELPLGQVAARAEDGDHAGLRLLQGRDRLRLTAELGR